MDELRERLRRYLEQRRELGERELVLDDLSVEEVMRLVGAAGRGPAGEARERRVEIAREPEAREEARLESPNGADWREALRAAAGAPQEPPPAPLADETPADLAPGGLVVGATSRELFGGVGPPLDTLAEIAGAVASCTRCPLYATAKNPVPGEGNPAADLVVVGEAPGANEDESGRPFVGQAGQLLTKILAAIELTREDVFICNVLKHRPPGNRNPRPEEVAACSPYLVRQIELIRPRAILALGTFAAQTLLDTKLSISRLRGQIHRYYGVPLIVTYHPAALLRNPAWKRPTWDDVKLARRVLDRAIPGA